MIKRLGRWLRVIFTGSSFVLFFAGGTLLATVVLPLVRLKKGTPEEKSLRCRQWLSRSWVFFHDYMRFWKLIDYDPRKVQLRLPDGPVVVIANHPTLVDVTALISVSARCICVAKKSMFDSPLLGRVLRYCGFIEGGDQGIFAGASVVAQAVAALNQGAAVLIFPEGTRSPEHGLRNFQQGAFEMAARANVPILPVLITCEPPTLMRGQHWYEVPERTAVLSVTSMPLVPAPTGSSVATLAKQTCQLYRQALER